MGSGHDGTGSECRLGFGQAQRLAPVDHDVEVSLLDVDLQVGSLVRADIGAGFVAAVGIDLSEPVDGQPGKAKYWIARRSRGLGIGMRHQGNSRWGVVLVEDTAVSRHIDQRDIDRGADPDAEQGTPAQDQVDYHGGSDGDECGTVVPGTARTLPRKAATARMPKMPTGIHTASCSTRVDSRSVPSTANGTARSE
jgi:hypothetical protein